MQAQYGFIYLECLFAINLSALKQSLLSVLNLLQFLGGIPLFWKNVKYQVEVGGSFIYDLLTYQITLELKT